MQIKGLSHHQPKVLRHPDIKERWILAIRQNSHPSQPCLSVHQSQRVLVVVTEYEAAAQMCNPLQVEVYQELCFYIVESDCQNSYLRLLLPTSEIRRPESGYGCGDWSCAVSVEDRLRRESYLNCAFITVLSLIAIYIPWGNQTTKK